MMDRQDDAATLIDAVMQGQDGAPAAALQAVLAVCARREADPVVRELAAQVLAATGHADDAALLRHWQARDTAAAMAPDPALREVFGQFESLGEDAEFGLVQSHFGVEPAGLLHGCTLSADRLIALLEQRFARLGEDGATRLDPSVTGAWWLTDTQRGLTFPTTVRDIAGGADQALAEQSRLLRQRAAALVARLEDGARIAVVKSAAPVKGSMAHRLSMALRGYGLGWSLVVTTDDPFNRPGTVRLLQERMVIGYVSALRPRLADDPYAADIRYDEWRAVCVAALDMLAREG